MLSYDAGVLCAPTAFGKTVAAVAMIARRGANTLVLVRRTELLKQWQARLQASGASLSTRQALVRRDCAYAGVAGNSAQDALRQLKMDRNAVQLFGEVKDHFSTDLSVTPGRMFGAEGLKIDGKVFAMVVRGHLVVKLPAERCAELIEAKAGTRFDPGHGRPMREWIRVSQGRADWVALASEAGNFVTHLAGG